AAILMGSPKVSVFAEQLMEAVKGQDVHLPKEQINKLFIELEKIDLSKNPDKLNQRPVLFWHGEADDVVPYNLTEEFYQQTKSLYANPEDYQFLSEKNRAHKVSRYAILET